MCQSAWRIEQAEGPAGWTAKGIAVEQVGHAADRLPEDDGRGCDDISEFPGVNIMMLGIEITDNGSGNDAALDCHAALPDERDF